MPWSNVCLQMLDVYDKVSMFLFLVINKNNGW